MFPDDVIGCSLDVFMLKIRNFIIMLICWKGGKDYWVCAEMALSLAVGNKCMC